MLSVKHFVCCGMDVHKKLWLPLSLSQTSKAPLHSFIKGRYIFYRGVATKYLNRYNALFQIAYRSIESKIALLIEKLFRPGCTMKIHTVKDIATHNLLAV